MAVQDRKMIYIKDLVIISCANVKCKCLLVFFCVLLKFKLPTKLNLGINIMNKIK